jgi:predicted TIM-barrel fold metal-dependent hydrolase
MEFTVDAVHRNLAEMKRAYPGRFYAFGDVDCRNSPEESVAAIKKAIEEYGLDGIKLHPNNSGVALMDAYNEPIFSYARQRRIPVAIHCYPNSETDLCTAGQIRKIAEKYPGLTLIVCHMGAHQWEQLLSTRAYVDISAILPDYVRTYGIEETNRILRKFGADRLLFATDYPDSRILQPGEIYETYFDILNRMDFTRLEAEMIARGNLERILNIHDTV